MAVVKKETVVRVTADADVVLGPLEIVGIKFIAGTSTPSCQLKADGVTGGAVLWQAATADSAQVFEQVQMYCRSDLYVTLAGTGSVLYLYLK